MSNVTHLVSKEAKQNTKSTALKLRRSPTSQSARRQDQQRCHKRLRYRVEVMFGTQCGAFKGQLQNLSRSGAYIEAAGVVPIGTRVLATIPFREKVGWVSVAGRVVRRDDGGIGLKFSR